MTWRFMKLITETIYYALPLWNTPRRKHSDYVLSLNTRMKEMELWRIKNESNMELLTREVKQQKETLNNTINQKIILIEKDTNSKFDLLNL